jgi:acetyl esterase/lipase
VNHEKIMQSRLTNGTLVTALSAMEWLGSRLGPYYARKRDVSIELNRPVPTWEGHTVHVDLYTPRTPRPERGWPVALMIHGGGWRFFSKDSHALIAAQIAEMGYLTIAPDYRLSPAHPFPGGLIDVLSVYDWMHAQAQNLNLDLSQVVVAGESAGASFALGISLLASGIASPQHILDPRFENQKLNWSVPKKAILHCGYHQVSNVARYDSKLSALVRARIRMIQRNYLPQSLEDPTRKHWGLADPLLILEELADSGVKITSSFPELFIPVGENDPVVDDSVRLAGVLERLGLKPRLEVYPKAPHSFYAMPWHAQYQRCWSDIGDFLRRN